MNESPGSESTGADVASEQQYVNGEKLLEILFPPDCRPTVRWLQDQRAARRIPFVKIGRLVFFSPAQVRKALENRANFKE